MLDVFFCFVLFFLCSYGFIFVKLSHKAIQTQIVCRPSAWNNSLSKVTPGGAAVCQSSANGDSHTGGNISALKMNRHEFTQKASATAPKEA